MLKLKHFFDFHRYEYQQFSSEAKNGQIKLNYWQKNTFFPVTNFSDDQDGKFCQELATQESQLVPFPARYKEVEKVNSVFSSQTVLE